MITEVMLQEYLEKTGHCLFGPSSLKQRKECPASAYEEMKFVSIYGPPPPSEWAAAGTMLHEYMEKALLLLVDGADGLRYLINLDLSIEQIGWCTENYKYAEDLIAKHDSPTISIEAKITLAGYGVSEVEGTADMVIKSAIRIDIVDWKFGQGVPVYAEDNLQGATYAAGAISFPVPDVDIHIHIAQAPLDSFTEWVVAPTDLERLMVDEVFGIVQKGRREIDNYGPSMSACRFCYKRLECEARHVYLQEMQVAVVKAAAQPAKIVDTRWIELLDAADAIQQAIKDCRAYAEGVIKLGGKFGDWKMVNGRGSRKPIDPVEFENFLKKELGDKAYQPRKLVTVAGAEKLDSSLKKDQEYKLLWEKVLGKPILVKGSDKRKALAFGSKAHFNKYIE